MDWSVMWSLGAQMGHFGLKSLECKNVILVTLIKADV